MSNSELDNSGLGPPFGPLVQLRVGQLMSNSELDTLEHRRMSSKIIIAEVMCFAPIIRKSDQIGKSHFLCYRAKHMTPLGEHVNTFRRNLPNKFILFQSRAMPPFFATAESGSLFGALCYARPKHNINYTILLCYINYTIL
jgi:hypothetical protein